MLTKLEKGMKKIILTIIILINISLCGEAGSVELMPKDKTLHFAGVAVATAALEQIFTKEQTFLIVTAMIIGKELYDYQTHEFSIPDIAYGYLGYGLVKFEYKF